MSEADASPSDDAPPRVIYVMGAGRSGSTILGVALGNCEGVFYAGELDKWLIRHGEPALDGSEREQFWARVRARVNAGDLFGYHARALERSSALFSVRKARRRQRVRRRYREVADELYRAIAAEAQATHVVDSSHYPLRARELQRLDAIELYLIFLVRDSQQVVHSFGRSDLPERRFNLPVANAYLWLTYALSVVTFLRHPRERRLLLCYEDFVQDPDGVLRYVLDRVGSRAALPDFAALRTGMPIQGNRLLEAQRVSLRRGAPSRAARSRVTGLLQLPWRIVLARLAPRAAAGPSR
jgi:Sulfotransferase family